NNYFINGPGTSVSAFSRGNENFRIYAAGNFQDADRNGVFDGKEIPRAAYGTVSWQEKAFDYPAVTARPALDAWKVIASRAGASAPRDDVDSGLIKELMSRGTLGEIIRRESATPGERIVSDAVDQDQDGMSDLW